MISGKSLLFLALFIIASLQYVSPYACPAIANCQTPDVCFAFDDDPSRMVWGPCEDCPEGSGTCLEKSSNVCVTKSSGCTGLYVYAIPNCSSATKDKKGNIVVNHICDAYPCCGNLWTGTPTRNHHGKQK